MHSTGEEVTHERLQKEASNQKCLYDSSRREESHENKTISIKRTEKECVSRERSVRATGKF